MIRLDIGCGKNKREGFIGVDRIRFDGVDHVCDVAREPLPAENDSVDEVHSSHFVEHLTALERIAFFNELYRVMKAGAKASIITPHWASARAYGDPTHQWPPFSEFAMYYLSRDWRAKNAPHTDAEFLAGGYTCDFDATWGYGLHPAVLCRNQEYQNYAVSFLKEAAQDLHATLTKRG